MSVTSGGQITFTDINGIVHTIAYTTAPLAAADSAAINSARTAGTVIYINGFQLDNTKGPVTAVVTATVTAS